MWKTVFKGACLYWMTPKKFYCQTGGKIETGLRLILVACFWDKSKQPDVSNLEKFHLSLCNLEDRFFDMNVLCSFLSFYIYFF